MGLVIREGMITPMAGTSESERAYYRVVYSNPGALKTTRCVRSFADRDKAIAFAQSLPDTYEYIGQTYIMRVEVQQVVITLIDYRQEESSED
jgi:hypothetical protein